MKIGVLTLLALAFSFAFPVVAQQTADPKTIEQFDEFNKKVDEAFKNNDAAAVAAFFMEDAVQVTPEGPIYGREAIDIAPVVIEGLPVKVISSGKSYKVFEQYSWEGHSSNYGPKGNRLNSSYGVGLGKNISSALLLRHGDWIHMPGIGWRQINEFASKKDSIEFFARYRDEYKSKHPRITIDMVVFVLPSEKDAKDMRDEYKSKHPRITIGGALNQKAKSHRSP